MVSSHDGKRLLVLVGGGIWAAELSGHPFIARSFSVLSHPGTDGAAELVARARPSVLLCSLVIPQPQLQALAALLRARPFPCTPILFATREPNARIEARASGFPDALKLFGRQRIFPRVIEALAVASGASLRVHLRADLQAPVEVALAGGTVAGRLLNLSDSGAKIATARVLDVGQQVTLTFQEEGGLAVRARVARTVSTPLGPAAGVAFEGVSAAERALLAKLLARAEAAPRPDLGGAEQVRAATRYTFPGRKVEARLTLSTGERINRLRVRDLSDAGCGVTGPAELHGRLGPGARLLCFVFDRDRLFKSPAELVHARMEDPDTVHLGLRFLELTPALRAKLVDLIGLWRVPRRPGGRARIAGSAGGG